MKARLSVLIFIVCLIAVLRTSAQATATPTIEGSYVSAPDIYVRGGPGESFVPVGRLIAGDRLFPLNRSGSGNWIMIRYYRGFGWIRRDLAAWDIAVDSLPTLDETELTPTSFFTETPTLVPTGVQVDAGEAGAYVRFGPGLNYPFLGAVLTGDYVEPVGRDVVGDWILIRFRDGFGWIARRLIAGSLDLNSLPVLLPDALTPSPTATASRTPRLTTTRTPSATATGTPTLIPTNTIIPTATVTPFPTNTMSYIPTHTRTSVPTNTPSNTATAAPTLTATPSPTATRTATRISTRRTASTSTPSSTATPTPSETVRPTITISPTTAPTLTRTPSATHTGRPTSTRTPTPSNTATPTPRPTATEAAALVSVATFTATRTPSPTATASAIPTPSPSPTAAFTATRRPSPTPTSTFSPTATTSPTLTRTPRPTASPSRAPTNTAAAPANITESPGVLATDEAAIVPPLLASETPAPTLAATWTGTHIPTAAPTATPTFTASPTPTPTALAAALDVTNAVPTPVPVLPTPAAVRIPPEVIVGGALIVLVLSYVALYWRGLSAADRYAKGFVIERCPVCKQGHLSIETRQTRVLGIPRPQGIVHCDHCRSVLREVGNRRWRYAVDRAASPSLYNQLNGRAISEETLRELERQTPPASPSVRPPAQAPTFVDDEE